MSSSPGTAEDVDTSAILGFLDGVEGEAIPLDGPGMPGPSLTFTEEATVSCLNFFWPSENGDSGSSLRLLGATEAIVALLVLGDGPANEESSDDCLG